MHTGEQRPNQERLLLCAKTANMGMKGLSLWPLPVLGSPRLLMVPGKQMVSDFDIQIPAGLPQYSLLFSVTESLVLLRVTMLLSLLRPDDEDCSASQPPQLKVNNLLYFSMYKTRPRIRRTLILGPEIWEKKVLRKVIELKFYSS